MDQETAQKLEEAPLEAPPEPEDETTRRMVTIALDALSKDPRSSDVFTAVQSALPVLAAANGVDPADVRVGDLLQAVYDAWGGAVARVYHDDQGAERPGVRL